jgi:NAD(P)-dependent dehydrogenase (short-subunit alcohol dehydrogenase family)
MLARSVLITGCSRGLGLELTRQLAPQTEIVIATARKPDEASELSSLALIHKNITILPLGKKKFQNFINL